jgi:hypothetical protein
MEAAGASETLVTIYQATRSPILEDVDPSSSCSTFHSSFLNHTQSVGLLGWGISPSQGSYLTQT